MFYFLLSDKKPHYTMPHHATPRHTTPRHTTPRHTTPHYATPRHTTPHHATPHHTGPGDQSLQGLEGGEREFKWQGRLHEVFPLDVCATHHAFFLLSFILSSFVHFFFLFSCKHPPINTPTYYSSYLPPINTPTHLPIHQLIHPTNHYPFTPYPLTPIHPQSSPIHPQSTTIP